jgi:hypothetical protein
VGDSPVAVPTSGAGNTTKECSLKGEGNPKKWNTYNTTHTEPNTAIFNANLQNKPTQKWN